MNKQAANKIFRLLQRAYPDARCSLHYRTPIQLVVATLLSAQSTDERVNLSTPALFAKYRSIRSLADAELTDVETLIKAVGLYRNKAKNIVALARMLVTDFRSRVPNDVEQLQRLPGIGRKSANVIKGELYGDPEGIAVDTHVTRLSFRLGLTRHGEPRHIEQDLMRKFDRNQWVMISHLLIYHGRAICNARSPKCNECVLAEICPRREVKQV
jgi:endonuclease-3